MDKHPNDTPPGTPRLGGMAQRILYTRSDGKWAWRLRADNGQVIATDGGQGYENEADARTMADRVVEGYYAAAEKRISRPPA